MGSPGRLGAEERGSNFASSGNYVQALGGANGTDGTGYDWISTPSGWPSSTSRTPS